MKRDTPANLPQWDVTVVDNRGDRHVYGVAARTRSEAETKAREYFNRGNTEKRRHAVSASAERRTA